MTSVIRKDDVKRSKDGDSLVIPLVKKHCNGVALFQSIDFVLLDCDQLSIGQNKVSVTVSDADLDNWQYDVTQTLTKLDNFRPYLIFMDSQ